MIVKRHIKYKNMKKSKTPIISHISDFLDYCEVEKGLSNRTQENYQRYLKKFTNWLNKVNKKDLLPHNLTTDDIWQYRLYLSRSVNDKGQSLKKVSQNYYLVALRAFLSYFTAKDIVSLPANKITLPRDTGAEKALKFLDLDKIEKLLNIPDINTNEGLRNKAIMESFFSTGLRISELVSLNKDLFSNTKDKDYLEIRIVGKGNRPRTVYFSERSISWIKKYLQTRKDNEKALFINYRAKKNVDRRLTPRSIERMVKKYAVQAGIPIIVTPHVLRHSFATDLLIKGVDIRVVQEFLGHKNIATTQIYTHITKPHLRETHRKFHSGDKLKD